jgi:ring-1,2-phenylacetyl-CoA epoxidase subunit PaaC
VVDAVIGTVLAAAGLDRPEPASPTSPAPGTAAGGRDGVHTEAMGTILAELQSVARANPDATW